MRHASSGGDLVPPTVIEEMKHVFENAELFVIYGCTEISCMGCTYPISRGQKVTRTFVGKPFPDVAVRVTDPDGNLVPFGAVGEICFAGKGVVHGYLNRPELTAEKFVEREGQRFYQTGDMGQLHPDGNVEILGRRDYQVQLRGIRVELPGIENTVREIGLAEQCAMVVKKLDEQDVRLVAFVVKPRRNYHCGLSARSGRAPSGLHAAAGPGGDRCAARHAQRQTRPQRVARFAVGKSGERGPAHGASHHHRASDRGGICQDARRGRMWGSTTISSIAAATRCWP